MHDLNNRNLLPGAPGGCGCEARLLGAPGGCAPEQATGIGKPAQCVEPKKRRRSGGELLRRRSIPTCALPTRSPMRVAPRVAHPPGAPGQGSPPGSLHAFPDASSSPGGAPAGCAWARISARLTPRAHPLGDGRIGVPAAHSTSRLQCLLDSQVFFEQQLVQQYRASVPDLQHGW